MHKAAIIEDEQPAIIRLQSMLSSHCPDVDIVSISKTGAEAIKSCEALRPPLIFLDIHLPDMKGFEVVKALSYEPYVIFTTAYKDYALEAFQTWAIAYLLKPFESKDLINAIEKYDSIIPAQGSTKGTDWEKLAEMFYESKERTSISITQGSTIRLVDLDKIAYISAEDKYCKLVLISGQSVFCDLLLKEVDDKLNSSFLRIHRSTIINISHVVQISKGFKGRFTFLFKSTILPSVRSGGSYSEAVKVRFEL